MTIDPDFERPVVSELHRVLTHGAGDLPQSIEKLIDDAESLIISLLRQRELMRHALVQSDDMMIRMAEKTGLYGDPTQFVQHRRAQQILLDVPANSPYAGELVGAPRTIPKPS